MNSRTAYARRLLALFAIIVLLSAFPFAINSQMPVPKRMSPLAEGYLDRARIMAGEGNYAGVIDQIKHLDTQDVKLTGNEKQQCAYLLAMALYQRDEPECVEMLADFAFEWPASPLALSTRLAAADYYFFKHRFPEAMQSYKGIDFSRINPGHRPQYDYRLALSLLKSGFPDDARPVFAELGRNGKFNLASRYYTAYIDYLEGDYGNAYPVFAEIEKVAGNGIEGISPLHYMAQIDYARGDYAAASAAGNRLLKENRSPELIPETERITGLALFKSGDYDAARKYLSDYAAGNGYTVAPDAIYALGVLDYMDGDLEAASGKFARLAELDNDLAQSACLYLGQIAVNDGDHDLAAIYFEKAARMDFDSNVTETALFNYMAARTHGGNIPFGSSVGLLAGFLSRYPSSKYAPAVRQYLATAYFNERDYAKALENVNLIPRPSEEVLSVKQKILYELGMQEMALNHPENAEKYLKEGVSLKGDAALKGEMWLWLGDALYAQKKYAAAENAYGSALKSALSQSNKATALYNLAYSQLWQDKYKASASSFLSAIKAKPQLPQRLYRDAVVRRADALYYSGDYRQATRLYSEAIEGDFPDADYALFRRAVMYGIGGNITGKLSELNALRKRFPNSQWIAAAMLETGQTYSGLGETQKAVAAFEDLNKSHAESSQAKKGMLNLAITYMKAGDSEKAVKAYREIITSWPSSEEALLADEDLRKFHAEHGGVEEYAEFLEGVRGGPKINPSEIEKLAFEGAETTFGDDVADIAALEKYAAKYPDGRYLSQALLDIAIGKEETADAKGALAALGELLVKRPDSPQVPEALHMKARLLEEHGTGSTEEILAAYRDLERRGGNEYKADAFAGIMRTTPDESEKLRYARLVKECPGLSAGQLQEAEYYEGSAMIANGNAKEGIRILRKLAEMPSSLSGAKAAVLLGEHLFESGDAAGAEKVLSEFTEAGSPHQYWLARGFIALADVCHAKGKDHVAVEYLKSLRKNYPGKELDIHDMIASRLAEWK